MHTVHYLGRANLSSINRYLLASSPTVIMSLTSGVPRRRNTVVRSGTAATSAAATTATSARALHSLQHRFTQHATAMVARNTHQYGHRRRVSNKQKRSNYPTGAALSLQDSNPTIRMDRGVIVIDPLKAKRLSQSDLYFFDRQVNDATNSEPEEQFPVLSFRYMEPHTVELLLVVTERMKRWYGHHMDEYLISTMATVSLEKINCFYCKHSQ